MGLFDRLDMGVKTSWNGPVILQAKYQFLGAPELRARSGNVSMAVTFGAGVTEPSGDSTVAGSGTTSHTNLTLTTYDIAWIAGVRVAETWMIYGGGFLGSTSFSGTINQSGAAVGALPVQGSTTDAGGNLGLQLDSVLGALKIEEAWVYASVGGITQPGFYTGACLSYRF